MKVYGTLELQLRPHASKAKASSSCQLTSNDNQLHFYFTHLQNGHMFMQAKSNFYTKPITYYPTLKV